MATVHDTPENTSMTYPRATGTALAGLEGISAFAKASLNNCDSVESLRWAVQEIAASADKYLVKIHNLID